MDQESRRELLRQLLLQVNPDIDAQMALQPLEKILAITGEGKWPLIKADEINDNTIAKAYTKATGIKITKVTLVAIDDPFSKTDLESEKEYNKKIARLWARFGDSLLGDSLWNNLRANLRKDLKKSLEYNLWENLGHGLADNLWLSLWDSLNISRKTGLRNILRDNLYLSLFYYLGFIVASQPKQAKKLIGLLNWYSQGLLFIGIKKDEPETLLL
ncbi:MAG: hypothetical protein AAB969_03315, partial [Patescibacteria group bacterium]